MFHVEHTPVEELPPPRRPLLDQFVDIRIEVLNREGFGQIGQASHTLTAEARFQSIAGGAADSGNALATGGGLQPANHGEAGAAVSNQACESRRPE